MNVPSLAGYDTFLFVTDSGDSGASPLFAARTSDGATTLEALGCSVGRNVSWYTFLLARFTASSDTLTFGGISMQAMSSGNLDEWASNRCNVIRVYGML